MRAAVFILYCALIITGAIVHEPWWDEAQAWLIARDASFVEIVTHVVRYEGHPPLWYLILAIPAKLGAPYWTMKVIAALCGAATVLLLLYGFPRVPLYIRLLAPFAFFIAYQYTVVARSYVLLGPLLLGIARIWDRRDERSKTFFTLLILLSHVSVHGFAISLVLLGVRRHSRRFESGGYAAALLNAILLVAMLWPPADGTSHVDLQDPLSPQRYFFLFSSIVPALFWSPLGNEPFALAVLMASAAAIALVVLIVWLWRNGVAAPFLLSAAAVLVICARYYAMWHEGIFFFLLLFASVLAFERQRAPRALDVAAKIIIVLLLLRHAQWTFQSLAYDTRNEFTGSARAAELLSALDQRLIYGTGVATVELQPYVALANARTAYWEWSPRNDWPYAPDSPDMRRRMAEWLRKTVAAQPDVIVSGIGFRGDDLYARALQRFPGYRPLGVFSGATFWKTRPSRVIAFQIFERRSDTPHASAPRSGAR